ncbi:putative MFS multidrug transporter [Annulohypoxylon truncatum]|uniref:putative MFS multidrug transporter n=1 Tax=Annulohypoxylon truncatum TaxID=327061 RepID=UPI0020082A89|nr:putative MFS multidrug transporter [Annulohypoxylon truncatum]KAI1215167.1 putative MFS multidrug transporter [Annulohypoxylon truncatum]
MGKAAEAQTSRLSASRLDGDTTSSAVSMLEKETGDHWAPREGEGEPTQDAENQEPSASSSTEIIAAENVENTDYVTGYKLGLLLVSVTTFFFLLMLDMSIISTAIPQITSDFHSLEDIGWYTGAYQLTSATLQPLTGRVYTRVSAKWVFLFFFFIFEVGSLLCAVSQSSVMFIIGRAVAGMGSSGLQNGALTVISGAVPMEKRPIYMSIMMAFGQTGLITGPLIGGVFTQYVTWRWCFYINLPLGGLAGLFLSVLHVPDQTSKPRVSFKLLREIIPDLDLVGFAIFAPAAIMFLLALQFGSSEYPWSSSTVIGLFVGAGVAFPIFLYWEYREGDKAMIPFSMIRKRIVWVSTLQFTGLATSVFIGAQFLPIYFQSVKGVGPTLSGVYMLPNILSSVLFIVMSGALITRLGYYLPWAVVASAGTTVAAGLISTWAPDTETGLWIGYQIIYGLRGCGIQVGLFALQYALPPAQSALGTAFLIFCQNFSAAVFAVVGNTIFTQTLLKEIVRLAPSVDPQAALAAGGSAEAVRSLVPQGSPELAGVIQAFATAFDTVCYMLIACAGLSFVASFGMGWVDVRKKKEPEKGDV